MLHGKKDFADARRDEAYVLLDMIEAIRDRGERRKQAVRAFELVQKRQ
jgi:hypothetical protein